MLRKPGLGVARVLGASVAPFLILFAPFLSYLQYQRHGFVNPEVPVFLLIVAGLAVLAGIGSAWSPAFRVVMLAGLLTFLVYIQAREPGLKKLGLLFLALCVVLWVVRRHASRIVSVMMLTVVVSTLVFPARFQAATAAGGPDAVGVPPPGRADLPLVVHLLLDEFIGPEGLPADLIPEGFKEDLQAFFVERGFRLFGKAYSEYPITNWAVPQLLNLSPGQYVDGLTKPGPTAGTSRLTRNAYFDYLASLGYAIRVHQPDYLYLCPEGSPASCRTYQTRALAVLNELDVPLGERLAVVAGTFLGQSEAYSRAKSKYRTVRRLVEGKVPLPAWAWEKGVPTSAASMRIFDAVSAEVSRASRGTAVFAHILMPHYPYVYDAGCAQRPAREWMERSDPEHADIQHGIVNVPESRAARYGAYLQQVACTERKIGELIDTIPAALRQDAVIIVQGDHGSRITLVDPTTMAPVAPATSDYADSFSTMFAVRSSRIEAGYDLRAAPLPCLLRALVESGFESTAGVAACSSTETVYFMAGGPDPVPHPLPDFWTAPAAGVPVPTAGVAPAGRPPAGSSRDR